MIRYLIGGLLLTSGMFAAAEIARTQEEVPPINEVIRDKAPTNEAGEEAAQDDVAVRDENTNAAKFALIEEARVSIRKECPEKRYVGTDVKYEITVVNESDSIARDVVVTDKVCETATFKTASEGGTHQDGQIVWELGDLPPRGSKTLTTTVEATKIGQLECPARVEWRAIAYVEDKCKTVVRGIPAILVEVIDLEDPIEVGQVATYEISVTNQGSADGENIVVKATLPKQLEYVSAGGKTEPSVEGQVITFEALETLAPKAKAVWNLKAKALAVGDIRFALDVTSDQSPEPISETESTNLYE